ncbi:MAG: hypothetical protein JKY89_10505, partial [Immundisolibacteraceae bacterium]|nr:hypothetical protein [Immundisolibacteraceae bacterium]
LAMVWSTNLFNFMDGTDGIASFEAITIYGVGGAVLWLHGAHQLALLAWIIVASVAGFLVWNWPKAKIFMGDVASSFLGFMVIPFALIGYYVYDISVFVWFVLYLMFTLDATLTLIRRLRHREKFYEAHKLHAYQRLHQSGYSHQRVLFVIIGMNCILSALAVVAAQYTHWRTMSIAGAVVVTVLYYVWVETKKPMYAAASIGREQRS